MMWVKGARRPRAILAFVRSPSFCAMRRRGPRRAAAFLALAAMLFAQAALALGVCSTDEGAYRIAMERSQAAPAPDTAPCGEHSQPAGEALHAAHCQASDQTLDKHQVSVPVLALQPVLLVQLRAPGKPRISLLRRDASLVAGAPPPRILFQSFLI